MNFTIRAVAQRGIAVGNNLVLLVLSSPWSTLLSVAVFHHFARLPRAESIKQDMTPICEVVSNGKAEKDFDHQRKDESKTGVLVNHLVQQKISELV